MKNSFRKGDNKMEMKTNFLEMNQDEMKDVNGGFAWAALWAAGETFLANRIAWTNITYQCNHFPQPTKYPKCYA